MSGKAEKGRLKKYRNGYGKYGACVITGFALYGFAEAAGKMGDPVRNAVLERNEYGGGDRQYELFVGGLGEKEEEIAITVPERKMSGEEMQENFPKIMEYLTVEILGENESLSEVRHDLNLTNRLEPYGLSVRWESGAPETVSDMGLLSYDIPENGAQVTLRAGISNGGTVLWSEIPVTVFPPEKTSGDSFRTFLEQLVETDVESSTVALPESFEGQALHYRTASGNGNGGLIFLGIAAALCLFLKEKSDKKEKQKYWKERMIADYPELLSGFVVLMGAGYPVRQAWKKQVVDGTRKMQPDLHPVYREMQTTLNQMETGMPEIRAYGEFGRRIGIGSYMKFASLLGNSVSTGGKDLRRLLEEEMEAAFRQRKDLALRKGEEASTKLLIPMFLMLGIVMIMVVAPAFLSL